MNWTRFNHYTGKGEHGIPERDLTLAEIYGTLAILILKPTSSRLVEVIIYLLNGPGRYWLKCRWKLHHCKFVNLLIHVLRLGAEKISCSSIGPQRTLCNEHCWWFDSRSSSGSFDCFLCFLTKSHLILNIFHWMVFFCAGISNIIAIRYQISGRSNKLKRCNASFADYIGQTNKAIFTKCAQFIIGWKNKKLRIM